MAAYILRRLALMAPTFLGIILINFVVIQFAPGGPIDQAIAQLEGYGDAAIERVTRGGAEIVRSAESSDSRYRGAQGLDPAYIAELEKRFGFDRPVHERFFKMVGDYLSFDFGESYFRDERVVDLVLEKMPVSISLGLWTTLLVYLISIPLGVAKAVRDGSRFDIWSSAVVVFGNAIPSFIFAVMLLVLFAGGSYLDWFPLKGLTSDGAEHWPWHAQVADYFWHLALPVTAMVVGGFATLTLLTKNSFLDQISQQYVLTARAKGLTARRVLYGHVFRNAMLIVIAGFPAAFVGVLFTGAVLIETIFSLDGLGLLGFEAALNRDYPIMFASLWFFTLLGLVMQLIGDLTYMLVDPRIDFETRQV